MDSTEITQQLVALRSGAPDARERLFASVYEHLKTLARREVRGGGRTPTLGATALVHEAYLRLVDQTQADWRDRGHFFAVAAQAMRHIAVDHARRRAAAKRGAGRVPLTLDDDHAASGASVEEVLAVHEALEKLAATSPRLVSVVELCWFAGLTAEEAAPALGVGEATIKRDWHKAKALLFQLLRSDAPASGPD